MKMTAAEVEQLERRARRVGRPLDAQTQAAIDAFKASQGNAAAGTHGAQLPPTTPGATGNPWDQRKQADPFAQQGQPGPSLDDLLGGQGQGDDDNDPDGGTGVGAAATDADPLAGVLARMHQLEQQLSAANGRAAPTQAQNEQFRTLVDGLQQKLAQQEAELQALRNAAAADAARREAENFDPLAGLSPEQLDAIDPTVQEAMRRAARGAVATATSKIKDPETLIATALAARDKKNLDDYRSGVVQELNLHQLANQPAFAAFTEQDDAAQLLLTAFLRAGSVAEARAYEPRVRRLLDRFKQQQQGSAGNRQSRQAADPTDRLNAALSRSAAGGSTGGQQLSPEQVAAIHRKARELSRKGQKKEARELLASVT